jgi:hypothetical protein
MILNTLIERLQRRTKDDIKGRHFKGLPLFIIHDSCTSTRSDG